MGLQEVELHCRFGFRLGVCVADKNKNSCLQDMVLGCILPAKFGVEAGLVRIFYMLISLQVLHTQVNEENR